MRLLDGAATGIWIAFILGTVLVLGLATLLVSPVIVAVILVERMFPRAEERS